MGSTLRQLLFFVSIKPDDNRVDRFDSHSRNPQSKLHTCLKMYRLWAILINYGHLAPTRFAITMLSSPGNCLQGAKWLKRFFSFSPKPLVLVGHMIAQTVTQMINCLHVDLAAWNRTLQSLLVPHLVWKSWLTCLQFLKPWFHHNNQSPLKLGCPGEASDINAVILQYCVTVALLQPHNRLRSTGLSLKRLFSALSRNHFLWIGIIGLLEYWCLSWLP